MGYRLNRLDEPVLMAVPKPMQTKFDWRVVLSFPKIRFKVGVKLNLSLTSLCIFLRSVFSSSSDLSAVSEAVLYLRT